MAMAQCEAGNKPACGDVSHWVAMPQCKVAVVSQSVAMRATTSLRRGGATLAFRLGLPMEQVMQHGDWRSLAVLEYNETSCADRQLVPRVMARAFASRPA